MAHAGVLAWSAVRQSPTVDEVAHLPAGIHHLQHGRFLLYRVNPPLVRAMAALPVLLLNPQTEWRDVTSAPSARPEFSVGSDFIAANGERSQWLFIVARWACIPFSLLGAFMCYRFAESLYGQAAGVWAASLWCFSPNMLGHGSLITPDVAAAAFGIAAGYYFWRWLSNPGWLAAFIASAALGLAELSKTSWIVLFGLWPAMWIVKRLVDRNGNYWELAQFLTIISLGIGIINLGYGFDHSFRPLGDFDFTSKSLRGDDGSEWGGGNRFHASVLGTIPVPFPYDYVKGIDLQKWDFERRRLSYLRGEFRHRGWWWYYLYGLAIKVPLATWCLLAIAAWARLRSKRMTFRWLDETALIAPAVTILVLISSQTGFSHHVRYALPILPFLFVWSSGAVICLPGRRWLRVGVGMCFVWLVASCICVYPHSLSYFNELVGGPRHGHRHLLDSNIDWGQDLCNLQRWLDRHPEVGEISVGYFGNFAPEDMDARFLRSGLADGAPLRIDEIAAGNGSMPAPPPAGWYAISVNRLYGYLPGSIQDAPSQEFAYFRSIEPLARIGYSINTYHIERSDSDE